MGKIYIDHGIIFEELPIDGLTVRGFADKDDKRTKLSIPPYIDGDSAPNLSPPNRCVKRIDDRAFKGNIHLQSVEIPDNIVTIGEHAFSDCVNLKEVLTYGRRPTTSYYLKTTLNILTGAFQGCINLEQVFLNREYVWIYTDAFKNCIHLRTFGGKICKVTRGAFLNCDLDSLTFADYAEIHDDSIEKSAAKELIFFGETHRITKKVLNWIKKALIVIHCTQDSSLVDLAYEGVNVSVVED